MASSWVWAPVVWLESDLELVGEPMAPGGRRRDIYLDNRYLDVKIVQMHSSGVHLWLVLMKAHRTLEPQASDGWRDQQPNGGRAQNAHRPRQEAWSSR